MSRITEALRRASLVAVEPEPLAAPVPAAAPPPLDLRLEEPEPPPVAMPLPTPVAIPLPPPELSTAAPLDDELSEAPEPGYTVEELPLQSLPAPAAAQAPPDAEVAFKSRNEKLILNTDLSPAVVEQYRKVATSLHQLQLDRGVKVVMIASAIAEDGKTITASNIALTLSESFRRRVLLIDADLRRPSVHAVFGTPNVIGLNDALSAEREEKLTVFEVTPRLSVLPSGRPSSDPMSSLASERMRAILGEAAAKFDWVIIDTPPVGVLADARLLAEMVQAVVLVIGAARTPFKAVQRAIEALDRKRIAGVVLNRVTEQPAGYHDYYGYYAGARAE